MRQHWRAHYDAYGLMALSIGMLGLGLTALPLADFFLLLVIFGLIGTVVSWIQQGRERRAFEEETRHLLTLSRTATEDATQRAERLLQELLTPQELAQVNTWGWLDVPSRRHGNRFYRIPKRLGATVDYLSRKGKSGRPIFRLCLQPTEWVPDADYLLMHKLWIEGDEAGYLKTAVHLGERQ